MFGSDNKKPDATNVNAQVADAVAALNNAAVSQPQTNFAPDPATATATEDPVAAPAPQAAPVAEAATPPEEPAPATPTPAPETTPEATEPEVVETDQAPASTDAMFSPPLPQSTTPGGVGSDGLLDIKQNALDQLKPLVDHLDSMPEEKFDALMMMIRASDDQALIQPAYEAAQQIKDDKKRAEALLDVVNEINYLTSSQQ